MNIKHSPGPWTAGQTTDETPKKDWMRVCVSSSEHKIICKVSKGENQYPDGLLIAAAFVMFDYILHQIKTSLSGYKGECKALCKDYDFKYWKSLNKTAIDIIENAKGKSIEEILK